jgi:ribonuclease HI
VEKRSYVPFFITRGIWLYGKSILFEGQRQLMNFVEKKILKAIAEFSFDSGEVKIKSMLNLVFFGNFLVGFFDGVANEENSGIGLVVKVSPSHYFKAYMAVGIGTNIRVKLLALWGLLLLSQLIGMHSLFIFGDSKVVVDWFNGDAGLNVLVLQDWKGRIQSLRSSFSSVQAIHIHREFNSQADKLSKLGLTSPFGLLQIEEFEEEILISSTTYSPF